MKPLDLLRIEARRHWVYDYWHLGRLVDWVNTERENTPFAGLWTEHSLKLLMGPK